MAKDTIPSYSATAANNTDVGGVNIQGTAAISNIDNAVREVMSHLKELSAGTNPIEDTTTFADPADLTKRFRFDGGSITAGATRVITVPDADATMATVAGTQTLTNKTLTGPLLDTTLALTGDITPAQITASQNDYAPTGHATASIFRLYSDAAGWAITGIAGGTDGRIIHLVNVGNFAIDLSYDSGSSVAGNRIYTVGGDTMKLWGFWTSVTLRYDATLSRWMVLASGNSSYVAGAAQMEAATGDYQFVPPSLQHRHPSAAKCWASWNVAGALQASYNVSSVTDNGTGSWTVNIGTDFSSAEFACFAHGGVVTGVSNTFWQIVSQAAGAVGVNCANQSFANVDPTGPARGYFVAYGDQ